MATNNAVISQAASPLDIQWTAGDPVSLQFTIQGGAALDGTYEAQVRDKNRADGALLATLSVSTNVNAGDLEVTMTLSRDDSQSVPAGSYYWDLQEQNGPTRFAGEARVVSEVTVDSTIPAP